MSIKELVVKKQFGGKMKFLAAKKKVLALGLTLGAIGVIGGGNAQAACPANAGGITVNVQNTNGVALPGATVFIYIPGSDADPAGGGGGLTLQRTSDAGGQVCLQKDETIGGTVTAGFWSLVQTDSNFSTGNPYSVWVTMPGFLTRCQNQAHTPSGGSTCGSDTNSALAYSSTTTNTSTQQMVPSVIITAEKTAGAANTAINFLTQPANRVQSIALGATEDTYAALRMYSTTANQLLFAPSAFQNNQTVTLKYKGFLDRVSTATFSPTALTQVQVDYDTVDGARLLPTMQVMVDANEVTDELANDLSAVAQVANAFTLSGSVQDGTGATSYAVTYDAGNAHYDVEAYSGTGGTWIAKLNQYVNATVTIGAAGTNCATLATATTTTAAKTVNFRVAVDAGACDGPGFSYPLKVNIADELSGSAVVTPANLTTRTFNGQTTTITNGSSVYWAQDTSSANAALVLNQTGLVNGTSSNAGFATVATSNAAQTVINLGKSAACANAIAAGSSTDCLGLQFPLKVTVADELGATTGVTSASVTATFNAVPLLTLGGTAQPDANAIYFTASAGAQALVVTQTGYVNGQSTNSGFGTVTTAATGQVNINLGANSDCDAALGVGTHSCKGLEFLLKVVVADEMGSTTNVNQGALTTKTFGAGAAVPTAVSASGNTLYWAVAGTNTNLVLEQTNYVNAQVQNTAFTGQVSTANTAQTTITLGDNAACTTAIAGGTSVNCRGLLYPLKVNVSDELSNSAVINPAGVTTRTFNGVSPSLALSNSLFWAVSATGNLELGRAGYVSAIATNTGFNGMTTNATGQTVINLGGSAACAAVTTGAANNCTGLQFSHRLAFTREGDAGALAPSTVVEGVTIGGDSVCTTSNANFVFCSVPTPDAANDQISASFTNMVSLDRSVTSAGRANDAAGQLQLTVDNVLFPLRVDVADQLSSSATVNATNLTTKTFNGVAAAVNNSNNLYWNTVATGALVLNQTDYVNASVQNTAFTSVATTKTNQTFVRLGNFAPCTTAITGQATAHTCKGLLFPLVVNAADELSTSTTLTTIDFNGNTAPVSNGGSLYFDEVASDNLVMTKAGYVDNALHNTGFATVSTSQTAQTFINLGASNNCTTTISAGSTNHCKGMMFTLKVSLADELGGTALTPAALDTATFDGQNATSTSGSTMYWASTNNAAGLDLDLQEAGFVDGLNTNAGMGNITINSGTGQTAITMGNSAACAGAITPAASATCKGLEYVLKVTFANFQGTAVNVSTGNFTHLNFAAGGTGTGGYDVSAASANVAYFSTSLTTGRLNFTSVAGKDPNNDPAGFYVNTINLADTGQTSIEFGNYTALAGAGATFGPGGATTTARGFTTNVVIDVCSDYPTGTDLVTKDCPNDVNRYAVKNLNVGNFFPKTATGAGGTYVSPSAFLEGVAGRYLLTVASTVQAIDVINLQTDSDAGLDYKNASDVTTGQGGAQFAGGWTTANLSASVEPLGHRLCFTTTDPSVGTPTCEASPFSVVSGQIRQLWVSIRDNDAVDRLVSVGADAAIQASIAVTGGPGDLAATTSGSGILFSSATSHSVPLSTTTVTLANGKSELRIRGGKITGTQFTYTLSPAGGAILNSASQALAVAVTTGPAAALTVQAASTQSIAGAAVNISASISDEFGNLVTGATNNITFAATSDVAGSNPTFGVTTGAAVAGVLDSTINTTVSSSQYIVASSTGLANSNPLTVSFIPGDATNIVFNPAVVTPVINLDGTITDGLVSLEVRDANGNIIQSNAVELNLTAQHSGTFNGIVPLAEFPAISNSVGTIVSDASTATVRSVRVRVLNGRADVKFRSVVANTIALTASLALNAAVTSSSQAVVASGPYAKLVVARPDESLLPGSTNGLTGTAFSVADDPETGKPFTARVYATDFHYNQTTNGVPTALTLTSPAATDDTTNDTDAATAATGIPANFGATGLASLIITPTSVSTLAKPTVFTATSGAQTANMQIIATVNLADPTLNLANILPAYSVPAGLPAGVAGVVDGTPAAGNTTITINGVAQNNGSTQTVPVTGGAPVQIILGPNTSDNPANQLGTNNGMSANLLVTIVDRYGNPAANVPTDLIVQNVNTGTRVASVLLATGTVLTPVGNANTDNNGQAVFDLSNVTNFGSITFQPRVRVAGNQLVHWGDPVRVAFNADTDAPVITINAGAVNNALSCEISGDITSLTNTTPSGACFVSGDMAQLNRPIILYLGFQDKTTNNTGVTGLDNAGVTVSIDSAAFQAIPVNCEAENATRDNQRKCTVTIPAFNTAGRHTIRLRVADRAGNATTQDFIVNIAGGATLANVINGPNPFNPITQPTKISFQIGEPSAGTIEIYSLAGFVVRRLFVNATTAGYHEVVWDGRDDGRRVVANGIYPYRVKLRSTTSGTKLVGKGKIAVIK